MLDKVEAALAAIEGSGTFAVEQACSSEDLQLEVQGIGLIPFPIRPAMARKLIAAARPAPFGRRDKTLHDKGVRDTWEIDWRRIEIDKLRWARTLTPQLAQIQKGLGLPAAGKLTARLDKMLLYEPGQFFAPHQDSERDDHMVGSLVVELPCVNSGGSVIVRHLDETRVFRGAPRGPRDLSLLAFYADCRHEVKPIASGFRIVLTYHLLYEDGAKGAMAAEAAAAPGAAIDRLTEAVRAYFATPIPRPHSASARPDRLVYLLDHEYTEKSLGWDQLKNADRPRAEALREVAERLDGELFLALADVHESWACEEEDWGGYRGRRYDGEEDEGEGGESLEGEGYTRTELIFSELELRSWVDRSGKGIESVPVSPEESEVCFTRSSDELSPFRSEHEGYMGNYGNSVDRWYHRAAVVLWPRERNFVIRAKLSPAWAVKELRSLLETGAAKEARARARELLPFWDTVAAREQAGSFVVELLAVLSSLKDRSLSLALLSPLGSHRLDARVAPAFAALVEHHGLAWAKPLFDTWAKHGGWQAPRWRSLLPGLCKALLSGAPEHGRPLATWLLEREVASFEGEHKAMLALPPAAVRGEADQRYRDDLLSLLESAAELGASAVRDDLLAFLTAPGTALPVLRTGELLRTWQEARSPAALETLGLGTLYRYAVEGLERSLSAPARSPADWSIEPPMRCQCELCRRLAIFLRAPECIEHAWPLAKEGRKHIHQMKDAYELPVAHKTTRQGRPYTLVLKKEKTLFQREAALREREKALLTWLEKHPVGQA